MFKIFMSLRNGMKETELNTKRRTVNAGLCSLIYRLILLKVLTTHVTECYSMVPVSVSLTFTQKDTRI